MCSWAAYGWLLLILVLVFAKQLKGHDSEYCLQFLKESESEVAQLCPILCDPMDCSPPDSSIHEIFQTRALQWVAIFFSSWSFWPRDRTWVSCIAARLFTSVLEEELNIHWLVVFYRQKASEQYQWSLFLEGLRGSCSVTTPTLFEFWLAYYSPYM